MAQPTAGPRDSLAELSRDGSFQRTPSTFRHTIAADAEEYRPEAGRYLLYVSYACPWANRCLAARTIKGLEHVIDVAVVAPIWSFTAPGKDEHRGWMFDASVSGATADPIWGAASIREVYERAHPGYVGKYTVPVLFDKKTRTIVNNESQEIVRMFNSQFNEFAKYPGACARMRACAHHLR
ncbi:hypothetical protein EON66_10810 [archaeon]|nr:MAG: hypothetical protein EON66_10810 [archaeon]